MVLTMCGFDTCCIDKSSSAELSEAINSMFRWYNNSTVCYVYLSDVMSDQVDYYEKHSDFRGSNWFTRGWTLQELLAPRDLWFYNTSLNLLGRVIKAQKIFGILMPRRKLVSLVSEITGIPEHYVEGSELLSTASIAMKLSWASARQTTRVEDIAYCLLGIFEVAMPMLYGEGMKAFIRLQEEIMKNDDDQSIFAWGYRSPSGAGETRAPSYFAQSPAEFEHCYHLTAYTAGTKSSHYSTTNKGLHIEMCFLRLITGHYIGLMNCTESARDLGEDVACLAIPLARPNGDENVFYRPAAVSPELFPSAMFKGIEPKPVYISRSASTLVSYLTGIKISHNFLRWIKVLAIHPPSWNLQIGQFEDGESARGRRRHLTILLHCSNKQKVEFVVRVDYEFVPEQGLWESAQPKTAKLSAAYMLSNTSLLKLAISEEQIDKMLNWKEDFVFERGFSGSEWPKGYTRQLHLDRSTAEWKIDAVDVGNPF